ncbi:uncharacterized protein ARMOST_12520 [Armillaria ostoyae]|uniref:Uncharacterized protein n=1 Tax=Armillaria ostoyae TaxID=47428 RepID=A0A284RK70_ARMOS|nr:uncharacterized protein ARMOST_12520 [Armillaria ostoyae]
MALSHVDPSWFDMLFGSRASILHKTRMATETWLRTSATRMKEHLIHRGLWSSAYYGSSSR